VDRAGAAAALWIEAGDVVGVGTDPEPAELVLRQRRDEALRQAAGVARLVLEDAETVAVVTVQAALGGNPDEALLVLQQRVDRVLRQPLFAADRLEVVLAPHRAGVAHRAERGQRQPRGQSPRRAGRSRRSRRRHSARSAASPVEQRV
jgi:hypothetical protein